MGHSEEVTALGRVIQEYMWTRRPPLNPSSFARLAGLAPNTVFKWLHGYTKPDPRTLMDVAQRTGISLTEMYRACGYTIPSSEPPHPTAAIIAELQWAEFIAGIKADPILDDQARVAVLERALQVRGRRYDPYELAKWQEQHVVETTPVQDEQEEQEEERREQLPPASSTSTRRAARTRRDRAHVAPRR